jgi:hypothetical protein
MNSDLRVAQVLIGDSQQINIGFDLEIIDKTDIYHQTSEYIVWLVLNAIRRGKVPVLSTSYDSLFNAAGKFILREKLQTMFDMDLHLIVHDPPKTLSDNTLLKKLISEAINCQPIYLPVPPVLSIKASHVKLMCNINSASHNSTRYITILNQAKPKNVKNIVEMLEKIKGMSVGTHLIEMQSKKGSTDWSLVDLSFKRLQHSTMSSLDILSILEKVYHEPEYMHIIVDSGQYSSQALNEACRQLVDNMNNFGCYFPGRKIVLRKGLKRRTYNTNAIKTHKVWVTFSNYYCF